MVKSKCLLSIRSRQNGKREQFAKGTGTNKVWARTRRRITKKLMRR